MWCCLFLTILQNEIQDFFLNFELSTLGSERVKWYFLYDVLFSSTCNIESVVLESSQRT